MAALNTNISFREKVVLEAIAEGISKTSRKHSISRVTITKWVKNYKKSGLSGLEDKKKIATVHPNKMKDSDLDLIIKTKREHSEWSGRKICEYLNLDYSPQTVNRKIQKAYNNGIFKDDDIVSGKSLYNLELKIIHLSERGNDRAAYQFELTDMKSGFLFLGFSYERTNLSLSIFIDYILKNFKQLKIDLSKVTIYTKKGHSNFSYSANRVSFFEYIVKEKYNVKLIYIQKDQLKTFKRKKNLDFDMFVSDKELLFKGFSFVILNNNFNKINNIVNMTPYDIVCEDHKMIDNYDINLPPVLVDKHLDNIHKIKSMEDYWYITETERKNILKKTVKYFQNNIDIIKSNCDNTDVVRLYKIIDKMVKSQGGNEILLNSLEERANSLVYAGKWQEAERLYEEALEIAKKDTNNKYLARLYRYLGQRSLNKGSLHDALNYLEDSAKLAAKINYYELIPIIHLTKGITYADMGKQKEAISSYNKVIRYSKKHDNNYYFSMAKTNLAILYFREDRCEKAVDIFLSIINNVRKLNNISLLAAVYGNLGAVFHRLFELSQSMNYNLKTLKLIRRSGNKQYLSILFGNFGNLYQDMGDFKRAQKLYNKQYRIIKDMGDQKNLSLTFFNIGFCYFCSSDYKKALENLKKSAKIRSKVKLYRDLCSNWLVMANIYKKIGNYSKAKQALKEVEKLPLEHRTFEIDFDVRVIAIQINIENMISKKNNPKKYISFFYDLINNIDELNKSKLNIRIKLKKRSEVYYNIVNYLEQINDLYSFKNKEIVKLNSIFRLREYAKKLLSIYDKLNRNSECYLLNKQRAKIEQILKN